MFSWIQNGKEKRWKRKYFFDGKILMDWTKIIFFFSFPPKKTNQHRIFIHSFSQIHRKGYDRHSAVDYCAVMWSVEKSKWMKFYSNCTLVRLNCRRKLNGLDLSKSAKDQWKSESSFCSYLFSLHRQNDWLLSCPHVLKN